MGNVGDPFVTASGCEVVAAAPDRAVVEQPALAELDNHVGVRHASALHAAGYEASRALVAAALADAEGAREVRLARSEISYTAVGLGPLQTVAEPDGQAWEELGREREAELACAVTTRNEAGKKIAQLTVTWAVTAVPPPMGR